jgi:hypothetical protein
MEDVANNRRPKFTPAEIDLLEEEAKLKDSILFGKFSGPSSALVHDKQHGKASQRKLLL